MASAEELADLVEAARHEREQRAESYARRVPAGEVAAERASIDYQCWCAIADWIETGRFTGFYGGADPHSESAPWISWPEVEAAAESAVRTITGRCDRQAAAQDPDYGATCARRARLVAIHRRIRLRRATIDQLNIDLRAERKAKAA